jgi:hypothetical protein
MLKNLRVVALVGHLQQGLTMNRREVAVEDDREEVRFRLCPREDLGLAANLHRLIFRMRRDGFTRRHEEWDAWGLTPLLTLAGE